jgi:hypothetical protein
VDVDVHLLWRNVKEQRQHRMTIPRQHVGIGPAHRADQQAILDRTPVDEKILVIRHAPVERRQSRHARQPRRPAFEVDNHPILGQFARDDLGHAGRATRPG